MAKLRIHSFIFSSKKVGDVAVCLEGSEKCVNCFAVYTEQGSPRVRPGLN